MIVRVLCFVTRRDPNARRRPSTRRLYVRCIACHVLLTHFSLMRLPACRRTRLLVSARGDKGMSATHACLDSSPNGIARQRLCSTGLTPLSEFLGDSRFVAAYDAATHLRIKVRVAVDAAPDQVDMSETALADLRACLSTVGAKDR